MLLVVKIIFILLTISTISILGYFAYKHFNPTIVNPICNENSDNNYTFSSPSLGKTILSSIEKFFIKFANIRHRTIDAPSGSESLLASSMRLAPSIEDARTKFPNRKKEKYALSSSILQILIFLKVEILH